MTKECNILMQGIVGVIMERISCGDGWSEFNPTCGSGTTLTIRFIIGITTFIGIIIIIIIIIAAAVVVCTGTFFGLIPPPTAARSIGGRCTGRYGIIII
jgi:hypothetical protein